ncbi:nucleoside-diphosphate-sugar pyrophosphorylase, partial [candidate division WOR-3 bacterium]|nr:nucleoside-diphosphate-sugar pyrophosphorylase [candidate division WOR-3 bacterium]
QSQNIYIKGKKAKIIDFQSARIGPLTYDITALLRDPYVNISKQVERKLIDYFLASLKKRGIRFKKREFLHIYHLTALQRNMQVLGAFANLSLNKNKVHFKKYIPRAIELIQDVLKKSEFKELLNIVNSPEVCP